jgi:hypothetical protein
MNLKEIEKLQSDSLENYLTKGYGLFLTIPLPLRGDSYDYLTSRIENFTICYNYIYSKLDKSKQIEFKYDTLDGLKSTSDAQTVTKLKIIIDNLIQDVESCNTALTTGASDKQRLSMNQIALKYVYEGSQITRLKGDEIAKEYGYKSGEKLFQKFTYYSSTANRKGKPNPFTIRRLQNKINLLESVTPLLSIEKQSKVMDEVSTLKATLEFDY